MSRVVVYAQRGLAVVGALTVTGIAGGTYAISTFVKQPKLPDKFVLQLDLDGVTLTDQPPSNGWLQRVVRSRRPRVHLWSVTEALKHAGDDPRVHALVANIGSIDSGNGDAGFGIVQDLADAVVRYRAAAGSRGATAAAYASSFGEGGSGGNLQYFLASSFDRIYMQPSGLLSLTGFAVSTPFFRGLLDKLGIRAQFYAREEYKSAAAIYTDHGYSPANKEATKELVDDFMTQLVQGVATRRGMQPADVQAAIAAAPLSATQALQRGLVNELCYFDQVLDRMTQAAAGPLTAATGGDAAGALGAQPDIAARQQGGVVGEAPEPLPTVDVSHYLQCVRLEKRLESSSPSPLTSIKETLLNLASPTPHQAPTPPASSTPIVAIITASGKITTGRGTQDPVRKPEQITSAELCDRLRSARANPAVRAVVLRINSPGGSAVASDAIHREVELTVKSGTPVVVSMGNVAASGGYYVASPASRIVALPATLTGSIGVLAGKPVIKDLLEEAGVNMEVIAGAPNADAFSLSKAFTPEQEARLNQMLDEIYETFISKVAQGRNMPKDDVRKVAKGRVWTGQQALGLGLIDRLGGLADAVAEAATLARVDVEHVRVEEWRPSQQGLLSTLGQALPMPVAAGVAAAMAAMAEGRLDEVVRGIEAAAVGEVGEGVSMSAAVPLVVEAGGASVSVEAVPMRVVDGRA